MIAPPLPRISAYIVDDDLRIVFRRNERDIPTVLILDPPDAPLLIEAVQLALKNAKGER